MRTTVLGASGYIGARLLDAARKLGRTLGTSSGHGESGLRAFDLADPSGSPDDVVAGADMVYVAAALSSPDVCSREPARARAINVTGAIRVIKASIAVGARVIFFSSDTVYGERDIAFDESAACDPAGDYAAMKCEVEQCFAGHSQFKAIRLSYVFSRTDKFTQYLVRCAANDEPAEIFHPFYRAIVHLDDVIGAAMALAVRWNEVPVQVINVGGPQVLSRIEFVETLRRVALPGLRFNVTEPAAEFFLSRPRAIRMQSPHLATLLGREPRTLEQAAQLEFDFR